MSKPVMFKYPSLGDPKPRSNQRVMLIQADKKHAPGLWTDDCIAWHELHAKDRKPTQQPLPPKEPA